MPTSSRIPSRRPPCVLTALAGLALLVPACARHLHEAPARPASRPPVRAGLGVLGMSIGTTATGDGGRQLIVDRVVADGPAMRAGLRPGDRILAIDGTPTAGLGVGAAARLLRGPADHHVVVRIDADSGTRDVTLRRIPPSALWGAGPWVRPPGGAGRPRVGPSDLAPALPVPAPRTRAR